MKRIIFMLEYKIILGSMLMSKQFFYKGAIPLKTYCDENGINYGYVIGRKQTLINRDGLTEQQAIDFIVDNYKKHYIFYEGIPLPEYCKVNGINISSIYAYASKVRRKLKITKQESYMLAIEKYNTKFVFYEGISLKQYCHNKGYNYNTVMSLRYKNMKRKKMNSDQATIQALEKYQRFIFLQKQAKDRVFLKENQENFSVLERYCQENNYDFKIIQTLIEYGYEYLQAIFMYQYWLNNKIKIEEQNLIGLVIDMENQVQEILKSSDSDITLAINLYYAGFNNLEITIFQSLIPIINKAVFLNPYYDKEEMKQHITLLVIEKLKTNFFISGPNLRSYMKKFVRAELIKYFYSCRPDFSVNKEKYEAKEYIDYLTDGITAEEETLDITDNDELFKVLTDILTPIQIKYVLYRFGFIDFVREPEEIKRILKITTSDINDFEVGVINKLRESPDVMRKVLK